MGKLNFLNRDNEVRIPTGGDFSPTGFIGEWHAAVLTTFMTEIDLKAEGFDFDVSRKMGNSGYVRYYWRVYDKAVEAAEAVGQEFRPTTVWAFEADINTVLFADEESRGKFGATLTYDGCQISTLQSKKHRHELHMVALPAAVYAYARAVGWDVPELPFKKLKLLDQNTAFSDDYQERLVGNPDKNNYQESALWKYRTDLWKALGEDNPLAYKLFNSGTKFDCSKENHLNEALGILHYSWNKPVWGRLLPVPDPRVDAAYDNADGQSRRLTIPALVEIFEDEKAARAAFEADRVVTGNGSGTDNTDVTTPALPANWKGYPEEWTAIMKGLKAEGPLPTVIKRLSGLSESDLADEIAATVEDVKSWWAIVE